MDYHYDSTKPVTPELKAYMLSIGSDLKSLLQLNPIFKEQLNLVVSQLNYEEPGLTMDVISSLLTASPEKLQELLETFDLYARANILLRLIKGRTGSCSDSGKNPKGDRYLESINSKRNFSCGNN
ncbi:MAG: LON peptidase substrate-binding domain-containing protein [Saprospiraceae bacterium]